MDILVTTPKSAGETARQEAEEIEQYGGYYFRTFHYRPTNLNVGDRIYFVERGYIRGFGIIFAIESINKKAIKCSTTGISWGKLGDTVVKYREWHWLDVPIPHRGFQGFQYVQNNPELSKQLCEMVAH